MILSDFLSRQETDKSDPHEIIPISFDIRLVALRVSRMAEKNPDD